MAQSEFLHGPDCALGGREEQGFGDAGKDYVAGPGLLNLNWSRFKIIHFVEGSVPNLKLRFEAFNVFDQNSFTGVDANSGDSSFGRATSAYGARSL